MEHGWKGGRLKPEGSVRKLLWWSRLERVMGRVASLPGMEIWLVES